MYSWPKYFIVALQGIQDILLKLASWHLWQKQERQQKYATTVAMLAPEQL